MSVTISISQVRRLRNEIKQLRAQLAAVGCTCVENPPKDWTTRADIPHHVDCNRFCIDLPDSDKAPAAYREAMARIERSKGKHK